jgi:exo-1,4-beta-D-glucosaminidase
VSATATSKIIAAVLFAAAITAPAASAQLTTIGLGGWQVQSSALVTQGGSGVSQPGFPTGSWLKVRPDDAGAVGTEVGALVQNGRCPNVFFSTNMKMCFGYMSQVGADTIPMFSVPWWSRTTFTTTLQPGQHAQVILNGVVGEAVVWVNGTRVASTATVQGAYTRYSFDVTRLVGRGDNALALEIAPNDPNTMFTLDNVDWTQIPPDNNTGIQFPIELHTAGPLEVSNAHVVQRNNRSLSESALTLRADVANASDVPAAGELSAVVTSPSGDAIRVHRWVRVGAGTTRTISFEPSQDPALVIDHPSVWWPYQMGAQPLYGLTMAVSQPGSAPDSQSETFASAR